MIRMAGKNETFAADDVLGKYVLVDIGLMHRPLGRPRIAVRATASMVFIEREQPQRVDGNKRTLTGNGEREDDGRIALKSIRCVCDNAAEVNEVMARIDAIEARYDALLRDAQAELLDMDGLEFGVDSAPSISKP